MKMNNTVLIRKLGAVDVPLVRTPADDAYVLGAVNNNLSLPIAYEIEAELLRDVVVGEIMEAFRYKRNGVETPGVFQSTPVTSIEHRDDRSIVNTANSVYEVIQLSPEEASTLMEI